MGPHELFADIILTYYRLESTNSKPAYYLEQIVCKLECKPRWEREWKVSAFPFETQ